MNFFKGALLALGPRLAAAAATIVVAKAAQHGLTLDPTETIGAMLGIYAALHRMISSQVNPGDAAKGRLVEAEKTAVSTGSVVDVKPGTS